MLNKVFRCEYENHGVRKSRGQENPGVRSCIGIRQGQVLHCAALDSKEESMGSRLAFWLNNLIYLKEKPAELRSPSQAGLHLQPISKLTTMPTIPL